MESLGPAILILARLIVMGPDGTHLLSEHRASIPAGATGLLKETLHELNFPSTLALHVTPKTPTTSSPAGPEIVGQVLLLRVELWSDAGAEAAGKDCDRSAHGALTMVAVPS